MHAQGATAAQQKEAEAHIERLTTDNANARVEIESLRAKLTNAERDCVCCA